jgi:ubiquinone/menaquinone biosynthesis C-methylase UbiE
MDSGTGYLEIAWDEMYAQGTHRTNWDTDWPSPELAGFVAAHDWAPGARAVDLGCGTGADAIYLASLGFDAVGVDISGEALRLAQKRASRAGEQVEWVQADVCDVPLDDRSVQLIVDRGCLHHFTHAQWGAYAGEMARLLAPGGLLFVRGMSEQHRHKNILRDDYVREHFDTDLLRVVRTMPYRMVGPSKDAAALLAVVERR